MKDAATRDGYGEALEEIGHNPNIVVFDAGVSDSTRSNKFGKKYPERFFNIGISEADMVCTAAGMATTGKVAFASSFACFLLGRTMDQILVSLAYSNTNVKLVGTHCGIAVGEDGPTAQMIVDLAYTRAMPNLTVLQPADWQEAVLATKALVDHFGPVYMRLGRPKVKCLYDASHQFKIGKAHVLKQGNQAAIFATGIMVHESLLAAQALEAEGIEVSVINISTIKPIDRETIIQQVKHNRGAITAEDHNIIGGLGDAVMSVLQENNIYVPLIKIGINDQFAETGSSNQLFQKYGLSHQHLIKAVKDICQMK